VTVLDLPLLHTGKVRELYSIDDRHLLVLASDRISAFDVVFEEPIPGKGRILTAMTRFWAGLLGLPTHLDGLDPDVVASVDIPDDVAAQAMLVRRAEMLPLECIVRGHISGSAWKEYQAGGTMHGEPLPPGLVESERLPEPRFTPSTKAAQGEHDENIGFAAAADLVGHDVAAAARELSLAAYSRAADHALARGIIIADTKFELGLVDGALVIADELLTPDSSRFWPADAYRPGAPPPSLDKQPIRDWAEATGWDKRPPAPQLPAEVVAATRARYEEAYRLICGPLVTDLAVASDVPIPRATA
jgi:phosphoribosylaminoimidazole-succinocarboxamide synthase